VQSMKAREESKDPLLAGLKRDGKVDQNRVRMCNKKRDRSGQGKVRHGPFKEIN